MRLKKILTYRKLSTTTTWVNPSWAMPIKYQGGVFVVASIFNVNTPIFSLNEFHIKAHYRILVNFYKSPCGFLNSLKRHQRIWISTAIFSTPAETHNERDEFISFGV